MELKNVPPLLYAADIALLPSGGQCPPADAVGATRNCFRFVFDPMGQRSFLPAGKIKPQRMHNAKADTACSMLALSMYSAEDKARARYAAVLESNPNAPNSLGTHLAEGIISTSDGVCTPITGSGHFDFHPYAGINIDSAFNIIGPLP